MYIDLTAIIKHSEMIFDEVKIKQTSCHHLKAKINSLVYKIILTSLHVVYMMFLSILFLIS